MMTEFPIHSNQVLLFHQKEIHNTNAKPQQTDLNSRKNKGDAFIMISHFRISSFLKHWENLVSLSRYTKKETNKPFL